MNTKKLFAALIVTGLMIIPITIARAQSGCGMVQIKRRLWEQTTSRLRQQATESVAWSEKTPPTVQSDSPDAPVGGLAPTAAAQIGSFVGSWEGVVTPEEGGPPPF